MLSVPGMLRNVIAVDSDHPRDPEEYCRRGQRESRAQPSPATRWGHDWRFARNLDRPAADRCLEREPVHIGAKRLSSGADHSVGADVKRRCKLPRKAQARLETGVYAQTSRPCARVEVIWLVDPPVNTCGGISWMNSNLGTNRPLQRQPCRDAPRCVTGRAPYATSSAARALLRTSPSTGGAVLEPAPLPLREYFSTNAIWAPRPGTSVAP